MSTDFDAVNIEPGLYWCRISSSREYDAILEITGKKPFLRKHVYRLEGIDGYDRDEKPRSLHVGPRISQPSPPFFGDDWLLPI